MHGVANATSERRQCETHRARADRLWRSVDEEPHTWRDFREDKRMGRVAPRFPDFKNEAGDSLWLDNYYTPAWARSALAAVGAATEAVDARVGEPPKLRKRCLWEEYLKDPSQWADYRTAKELGQVNTGYTDFKRGPPLQQAGLGSSTEGNNGSGGSGSEEWTTREDLLAAFREVRAALPGKGG